MRAAIEEMKEINIVGETLTLKSALQPGQEENLAAMADALIATL